MAIENQTLRAEIEGLKQTQKSEKAAMLEHLHGIEENYQKYAFYYTKYLEERVAHSEAMKKLTQEHEESKESVNTLVSVISAAMEVLQTPMTSSEVLINSCQALIAEKMSQLNPRLGNMLPVFKVIKHVPLRPSPIHKHHSHGYLPPLE